MTLDEAIRTLLGSHPDDWHLFSERIDGETAHTWRATYRPDVLLVLQWGRVENANLDEDWVKHFPDQHASCMVLEAFYGGSLTYEALVVSVDGGRYTFPLPKLVRVSDDEYEFQLTMEQESLGRLVHDLTHIPEGYTFEDGMKIARFKVVAS